MRESIPAFLRHLEHDHAPRTISTYRMHLDGFATFVIDVGDGHRPAARADIEAFLSRPLASGNRRAPSARNQALAALRAFFRYAVRENIASSDPTEGVPLAREAPRDPPVLSIGETRQLFATAADMSRTRLRARNIAIVAILSQAGLRVHELVALNVGQVDVVSATLVDVKGKGGTRADIPLDVGTLGLISTWIGERRAAPDERALFVAQHGRRLSIRAVQYLFERLREEMGTSKRISPHTMRHTAATLSIALGTDLVTVASLLRHSDLNTTRRYIHLVDTQRREAVHRLATTIPANLLEPPPAVDNVVPIRPNDRLADSSEARPSPRRKRPCVERGFCDAEAA